MAPVSLRSGARAPAFTSETLAGQSVNFPGDYRGKLVLLDFWATWCVPCQAERPYIAAAREKYADRGLVVVGVPLDTGSAGKVRDFVEKHGMVWDQLYQNASAAAGKYGVTEIPAAFLIDGSTGAILAQGDALRGDDLAPTIERNLHASAETTAEQSANSSSG